MNRDSKSKREAIKIKFAAKIFELGKFWLEQQEEEHHLIQEVDQR